ncbi:hypothetical protein KAX21_05560, partial [candidate division WOR-3 bacterium]|nr:hypothetical protein [candidate division WOR-3 bacterium]
MNKRRIFFIIAIAVGILLLIILAKKMGTVTDQPVLQRKSKHKRIREEREIGRLNVKSLDIGAGGHRITVDVGIYRRENGMLYVRVMIDGKLIRRSLQTRKESEALLKTRSVIMAALEGQKAKEVPTLAEFTKTYLAYS